MFDTMSQDNFLGGTLTVGQFRQCKLPKNKKSQALNYDKVHIFWEGHKTLRNLHRRFDQYCMGQIYGGYFPKFAGLLTIYEL